jgi:uncharacterized protein YPO0396
MASSKEATNIKELVNKLEEIQFGLKQNLANLQQKLETLDSKPDLLSSLERFKKNAETRASDLEVEVKQLRDKTPCFPNSSIGIFLRV